MATFISGGDITTKLETKNELTTTQAKTVISGIEFDAQLDFAGRAMGTPLDSIAGYPDDLPQLQIVVNADGSNPRLCFYEYFVFAQNLANWQANRSNVKTLIDWDSMQNYANVVPFASEADFLTEKAAYCAGRVYVAPGDTSTPTVAKNRPATVNDLITNMATPKINATSTISALPVQRLYWYGGANSWTGGNKKQVFAWQWMFENVQNYINRYLTVPYVVTDLIPYGSNWVLQFQNATTGQNHDKVVSYLSGCNFIVQPIGKQDFWDKFYLVAPILISTVASLESGGAAAPELIAAIGALVAKNEGQLVGAANQTGAIEASKDGSANQNTTQIKLDSVFGNLSDFQFFAIVSVILILLIALIFFHKKQ